MRCEGVSRSLNDLSQYYVMPWVLSNYESETIDLEDEANYRDLSKPVGAQLKERREVVQVSVRDVAHKQEKYDTLQSMYVDAPPDPSDPLHLLTMPPRHYATFYSNAAMVLWFLVRIEPFTSYHISLQDGRFDRPDRQFHSMREAFRGAVSNDGDCKELIPELFYMREVYENCNAWDVRLRREA